MLLFKYMYYLLQVSKYKICGNIHPQQDVIRTQILWIVAKNCAELKSKDTSSSIYD